MRAFKKDRDVIGAGLQEDYSGGVGWRESRQRDQLGSLVWREEEEETGGVGVGLRGRRLG